MRDLATRIDAWLDDEEPRPLTRRERAAMELALRVLRPWIARDEHETGTVDALVVIGIASDCGDPHAEDIEEGLVELVRSRHDYRGVALRLALYLRARLRADRGETGGRWECESCGDRNSGERLVRALLGRDPGAACCDDPRSEWTDRITPLWQRAGEARR